MIKKAFEIIATIEHKRADYYWLYRKFPSYVYISPRMLDILRKFYDRYGITHVGDLKIELDTKVKKVKDIWIR